jgi:TonB family protein
MSPSAIAIAVLLHVAVALLLWWLAPLNNDDEKPDPIEVTMEAPPPKPEPKPEVKPAPEPPKPPAAQAKPPPPPPQPPLAMRGLVPAAPLGEKTEGAGKPRNDTPEAKPTEKIEEPAPEKSDTPQQAFAPPPAAVAPPAPVAPAPEPAPPPPPPLEKELPPIDAPPAPLTSQDFPKAAPPPPEPKPQPQPQPPPKPQLQQRPPVQAQPQQRQPAPQTALAPSPLSHLPQRGAPPPSTRRGNEPPSSPFVNPADARARNDLADTYLQSVNYKISSQPVTASADWVRLLVVVRFTIARDGRLVDISVARSSGNPEADRNMLQTFRAASPFPPVPAGLPGDSITFTMPVGFVPH